MEIKKWTGLHNTGTPESMEPGQMEAAYDVDIDADFKVRTRLGQTQISAVMNTTSISFRICLNIISHRSCCAIEFHGSLFMIFPETLAAHRL